MAPRDVADERNQIGDPGVVFVADIDRLEGLTLDDAPDRFRGVAAMQEIAALLARAPDDEGVFPVEHALDQRRDDVGSLRRPPWIVRAIQVERAERRDLHPLFTGEI